MHGVIDYIHLFPFQVHARGLDTITEDSNLTMMYVYTRIFRHLYKRWLNMLI